MRGTGDGVANNAEGAPNKRYCYPVVAKPSEYAGPNKCDERDDYSADA